MAPLPTLQVPPILVRAVYDKGWAACGWGQGRGGRAAPVVDGQTEPLLRLLEGVFGATACLLVTSQRLRLL